MNEAATVKQAIGMIRTNLVKWISENVTNVKPDDLLLKVHDEEANTLWMVKTKKAKLVIQTSGLLCQVYEAKNYYCALKYMVSAMREGMSENGQDVPPELNNKYGAMELSPFTKKDVRFNRREEESDMPFLTGEMINKNGVGYIKTTIVEELF